MSFSDISKTATGRSANKGTNIAVPHDTTGTHFGESLQQFQVSRWLNTMKEKMTFMFIAGRGKSLISEIK
jgi:hypothetical protein